jgi:hypothetical protein
MNYQEGGFEVLSLICPHIASQSYNYRYTSWYLLESICHSETAVDRPNVAVGISSPIFAECYRYYHRLFYQAA